MKVKLNEGIKPTIHNAFSTKQEAKLNPQMSKLFMDMLAKIYTNPGIACLREYTANAVDAHKAKDIKRPVEVFVPSIEDPIFRIKDYGIGLSLLEILGIYGHFGASTKNTSDEFIGGFGIGSKSGLAVSDCIEVISVKDGLRNHFLIKREDGTIYTQILKENEAVKNTPSGTEISIKFNKSILESFKFTQNLRTVFSGWSKDEVLVSMLDKDLETIINSERIPDTWVRCKEGYLESSIKDKKCDSISYIVGGVFYPHRSLLDVLGGKLFAKLCDNRILSDQPIVLDLDIGKTKLNYAREFIDFEASEETRNYVYEQICNVRDYLKEQINDICSRFNPDAPANTVKEFARKGINPIRILRNLDIDDLLPKSSGASRGLYGFEITIKGNKSIGYSSTYYPEQSDVIDSILIVKDDDAKLNDKTVASRLAAIVKNCSFKELKDFWHKDLDPSLTAISKILERIKRAVRKKSFEVILVEKDHYDKLAYKDFAHVITSSEIDKEFNKIKKKTKQTTKPEVKKQIYLSSRGLYFGNTAKVKVRTHINSIIETIDWEANTKNGGKTLLLPINTKHEIASKGDKLMAASLISMTLHKRIAYTKSEEMYKELITNCSNIEEISDDELESMMLANITRTYLVHKSSFFRCVSQKLSSDNITVMSDDEKHFVSFDIKSIIDPANKLTDIINNAYAIERERLVIDQILRDDKSKNPTIRFIQDAYEKLNKTHVPFKNGQTWRLLYNIMNPALYVKVTESQIREITEKTAQEEREILDYVSQNCSQKGQGLF